MGNVLPMWVFWGWGETVRNKLRTLRGRIYCMGETVRIFLYELRLDVGWVTRNPRGFPGLGYNGA